MTCSKIYLQNKQRSPNLDRYRESLFSQTNPPLFATCGTMQIDSHFFSNLLRESINQSIDYEYFVKTENSVAKISELLIALFCNSKSHINTFYLAVFSKNPSLPGRGSFLPMKAGRCAGALTTHLPQSRVCTSLLTQHSPLYSSARY